MSFIPQDSMWAIFQPLWKDLNAVGGEFLIAGGYGLFLKQSWLFTQSNVAVVIPADRWRDITPRVTKDVDLIVSLELLASQVSQANLVEILKRHQFHEYLNPRWQFARQLDNHQHLILEFHAYPPSPESQDLLLDGIRVKHNPSLGVFGIHGRENRELLGYHLYPFKFEIDAVPVCVPNAVTWLLMKITAMHDRWLQSENTSATEEQYSFQRLQAIKHAQDVCRIVALVTREERDLCAMIINEIKNSPVYQQNCEHCSQFFSEQGWGTQVVASNWDSTDLTLIRQTLFAWFPR